MANPISDLFKDYPSTIEKLPTMRPEQIGVQNQVLGSASNLLNQQPYSFNFAPIEKRAVEQFKTQTVPGLAERFLGRSGVSNSSSFQGALGSAASDLQTNLAALGAEYGLKGQQLNEEGLRNRLAYGLSPSFENVYTPGQAGIGRQLAEGAASSASGAVGRLAGEGLMKYFGLGNYTPTQQDKSAALSSPNVVQALQNPETANAVGSLAKAGLDTGTVAALASKAAPAAGVGTAAAVVGFELAVLAGMAWLIHSYQEEGKTQEAQETQKQKERYENYLQKKAQGETVRDPNLPQREPNEPVDQYLQRLFAYNRQNNNPAGEQ